MARPAPFTRAHRDWLGLVQPTGLVVSATALVQAGAVLPRSDAEGQRLLRSCIVTDRPPPNFDSEPQPYLPDFEHFARTVLGWGFSPKGYAGTAASPIPRGLELDLPQYGETLRPDFAVRERDPADGAPPWQLLVQVLSPGTDMDAVVRSRGDLDASPHGRLERLLRGTKVPAGLLFNGRTIRLLSAPSGESSGWMDFHVRDMATTAGRPLCAAMRLLLSEQRLLALPRAQRLAALLERSRQYQNEVGERLSEQVLHGLYELVRGFHAADQQVQGQLLGFTRDDERNTAYRAFLNVMLRLVFLLYAEERDLLSEDETFVRYYSLGGLYERLRADQGLHPDTMDARYGAWSQLLNLFRMVYEGARTDDLQLTARYGDLFDPSRFPFLEGWRRTEAPQVTQAAVPPLVPDGTVYRILDKLMVLDGERISYRALDVEQIGSVYETMMGFRIERSTGRSVAIKAQLRGGAPTTIDLDALLGVPPGQRAKWVEKRTGRKLTKTVTVPLRGAHTLESVHAALGRVVDRDATPDLVPPGSPVLQPSDERRASGSFYTPRKLTSPIVEAALEPVLENLGEGGVPEPAALLDLKVCDLAMGSAAFLVEACRQLGDHLVEAWRAHGGVPDMLPTEDEVVVARRLIAERCLYGVDRNPMAADLAKVSLWLVTLSRDRPLTFVDHALRSGDSLLGLSQEQIGAFTWKKGPLPAQLELQTEVRDAVEAGSWLRREIAEASPDTSPPDRADWLRDVDEQLLAVRLYGDVVLEAFFSSPKAKKRKANRYKAFTQIAGGGGGGETASDVLLIR